MTEIQALLRSAEIDAERVSALIRLVIFMTLGLVILSADQLQGTFAWIYIAIIIYGIGTIIGLVLAWRRIFHPVIPYLFVTFDIALISTQVLLFAEIAGMGPDRAFALPVSGLVFVVLIHSSMRYRPWLILFTAILFAGCFLLADLLAGTPDRTEMSGMRMMQFGSMEATTNFEVVPIVLIALSALILFVASRRTRDLLLGSIRQARRTARLSRYFSPNLAAKLADSEDAQLLAGHRQNVAVLFIDIRGFTNLGESMAPDELSAFISEYRDRLTKPIFEHGGTVDKFIGDAIMAVFGTPIQHPDDPNRAVRCALGVLEATNRWSEERERSARPPVGIGIGVHYGEVFAGAIGNDQLLEYTVIGDTVNVAERLERLSRDVESSLVVSAALLDATTEAIEAVEWRRLPPQSLKGHQRPVEAYCLVP